MKSRASFGRQIVKMTIMSQKCPKIGKGYFIDRRTRNTETLFYSRMKNNYLTTGREGQIIYCHKL